MAAAAISAEAKEGGEAQSSEEELLRGVPGKTHQVHTESGWPAERSEVSRQQAGQVDQQSVPLPPQSWIERSVQKVKALGEAPRERPRTSSRRT